MLLIGVAIIACSGQSDSQPMGQKVSSEIDLTHWKLTLPLDKNGDGKPDEYLPVELAKFKDTDELKPNFYTDEDGGLVFYCQTSGDFVTTKNSKSPRTELREQLEPGSNNTNWTLAQGGKMKGRLQITRSSKGDRFMVMQIHGRLTDEQRATIGKDDNDAPPLLKIYYNNGQIEVAHKVLKDKSTTGDNIFQKSSWTDAQHYYFSKRVENEVFSFEIEASEGKLVVIKDGESKVFEDPDLKIWPFENYFKAGNYLTTSSKKAFSEVKYYELTVVH